MAEAPAIGIDFGFNYCCVGVYRPSEIEIIINDQGNKITPCFVAFTEKECLIGEPAKEQAAKNCRNTIFDVKRLIGQKFSNDTVPTSVNCWPYEVINDHGDPKIKVEFRNEAKIFSPEEILSMILVKLKEITEAYLGKTVKNAVITVPAYFNHSQKRATKDAATFAGLNVLRIIYEPVAATLVYVWKKQIDLSNSARNVLVFDLDYGVLDVSIVGIQNNGYRVISAVDSVRFNDEDFDNRLVNYLIQEFERKHKKNLSHDKRAVQRLKKECEQARETLSALKMASIVIKSLHKGIDFYTLITPARFEKLNADLFENMMEPVKEAISKAKIDKDQIDDVLLVGGSSRAPKIQTLLQDFFNGRKLIRSVDPVAAKASGAALHATSLESKKSQNATISSKPAVKDLDAQTISNNTNLLSNAISTASNSLIYGQKPATNYSSRNESKNTPFYPESTVIATTTTRWSNLQTPYGDIETQNSYHGFTLGDIVIHGPKLDITLMRSKNPSTNCSIEKERTNNTRLCRNFGSTTSERTGSTEVSTGPSTSVTGTETIFLKRNGVHMTIKKKLQCITGMEEYENESFEELRYKDYLANRKVTSQTARSLGDLNLMHYADELRTTEPPQVAPLPPLPGPSMIPAPANPPPPFDRNLPLEPRVDPPSYAPRPRMNQNMPHRPPPFRQPRPNNAPPHRRHTLHPYRRQPPPRQQQPVAEKRRRPALIPPPRPADAIPPKPQAPPPSAVPSSPPPHRNIIRRKYPFVARDHGLPNVVLGYGPVIEAWGPIMMTQRVISNHVVGSWRYEPVVFFTGWPIIGDAFVFLMIRSLLKSGQVPRFIHPVWYGNELYISYFQRIMDEEPICPARLILSVGASDTHTQEASLPNMMAVDLAIKRLIRTMRERGLQELIFILLPVTPEMSSLRSHFNDTIRQLQTAFGEWSYTIVDFSTYPDIFKGAEISPHSFSIPQSTCRRLRQSFEAILRGEDRSTPYVITNRDIYPPLPQEPQPQAMDIAPLIDFADL